MEEGAPLSLIAAQAREVELVADFRDGIEHEPGHSSEGIGAARGKAVADDEEEELIEGLVEMGGGVEGMLGEPVEEGASGAPIGMLAGDGLLVTRAVVVIAEGIAGGLDQIATAAVVRIHEVATVEIVVHGAHWRFVPFEADLAEEGGSDFGTAKARRRKEAEKKTHVRVNAECKGFARI
jgi:hypothetical protein